MSDKMCVFIEITTPTELFYLEKGKFVSAGTNYPPGYYRCYKKPIKYNNQTFLKLYNTELYIEKQ